MHETLNNIINKYIDYGTEEYVKSLLVKENPSRVLQHINPYIGVICYPSDMFLKTDLQYGKRVQFQNTTYMGHMEFLLPPLISLVNVGLAYTILRFRLDGKVRQFVQISSPDTIVNAGISFKDFIFGLYPNSDPSGLAFNRHAFHYLTDIEILGGKYLQNPETGDITLDVSGSGTYTPSIEFEIAISGYSCLLQ